MKKLAARDYEDLLQVAARHLTYSESFLTVLAVCDTSFRGFVAISSQRDRLGSPVYPCNLACICQIAASHQYHSRHTRKSNQDAWLQSPTFLANDLQLLQNDGAPARGSSTWAPSSCSGSNKLLFHNTRDRQKATPIQFINIQAACPWRLRKYNTAVRHNRQLYNASGMDIFAIIDKLYLTGTCKGELEHRRVKRFYGRTNKQQFVGQIAKHQRRERLLQRIKQRIANKSSPNAGLLVQQSMGYQDTDELPYTKPEAHYHISASEKEFFNVASFLSQNRNERALEVSQSDFRVPSCVPLMLFLELPP